jgi:hypothetical protein
MSSLNYISAMSSKRVLNNILLSNNGRVNVPLAYSNRVSSLYPLKQQIASNSSSSSSEEPKKKSNFFRIFTFTLVSFNLGVALAIYNPDSRKLILDYFQKDKKIETKNNKHVGISTALEFRPISADLNNNTKPPKEEIKKEKEKENKPEAQIIKEEQPKLDLKEFQLKEEATINAIENKLDEMIKECKHNVYESLTSSYVAIESLESYGKCLKAALDDTTANKDEQWRKVTVHFEIQSKDVNEAKNKHEIAR